MQVLAFECRDLCFVLLKKIGRAGILIKLASCRYPCPASSFLTQIRIRLREMSWAWRDRGVSRPQ
jgi:hypothetical protein